MNFRFYSNPDPENHLHDFLIPNTFTPDGDGNNDVFKPVFTLAVEYEFSIYSRWGLVFHSEKGNEGWYGDFGGNKAEPGAYVWEIIYLKADQNDELGRIQRRGIVNLVR